MGTKELLTKSAEETKKAGREFGNSLKGGEVIGLVGDLGGGKTTFVQGIAEALGVETRTISPTFIIVREYKINKNFSSTSYKNKFGGNLYHVDLYRLEGNLKNELESLGILNFAKDPKNVVVIEWADKAREYLPENTKWITFENLGKNERKITL